MVGEGISLLGRRTLPKRDEVDFFPLYDFSQKTFRHPSLAVGLFRQASLPFNMFYLQMLLLCSAYYRYVSLPPFTD